MQFLGFEITKTGIQPTRKYIEKIMNFPSPASLTDVRSWFGLVNQVSYSFAIADQMDPFRKLLSSKVPFAWSDELEVAFKASKEEIIRQCRQGIRNFTPGRQQRLQQTGQSWLLGVGSPRNFVNVQQTFPDVAQMGGRQISFRASSILKPHPIINP